MSDLKRKELEDVQEFVRAADAFHFKNILEEVGARKRAWIQGARSENDEGILHNMSRRPNKRNDVGARFIAPLLDSRNRMNIRVKLLHGHL